MVIVSTKTPAEYGLDALGFVPVIPDPFPDELDFFATHPRNRND